MPEIRVRPVVAGDVHWVRALLTERWGSPEVVSRGVLHHADALPGFAAVLRPHAGMGTASSDAAGLVTFHIEGADCQVVTLDSLVPGLGIGSRLLAEVREHAARSGCRRLWLITTNDNTHALRFYQRRGLVLAALQADQTGDSRLRSRRDSDPGRDRTGVGDPFRAG
jgi:GNAT superfamily N-acetyltransferase